MQKRRFQLVTKEAWQGLGTWVQDQSPQKEASSLLPEVCKKKPDGPLAGTPQRGLGIPLGRPGGCPHLGQRQMCSHTRSWPEAHIRLCSQAFFCLSLVISVNSHRATLPLRPKVCSQRSSGQDPGAAGLTRLVPAGCSGLDPISRMYQLPTSVLLL